MSLLLYGVLSTAHLHGTADQAALCGAGVEGAAVELIEWHHLAAAVSRIDPSKRAPTIARALAFARIVDTFHACRTVVPMRYGCWLDGTSRVVALLHDHAQTLTALLQELDGCVEYGIRILPWHAQDGRHHGLARHGGFRIDSRGASPGSAYLAWRRAVYAEEARQAHEIRMIAEQVRAALSDSFVKFKPESSASLHFLIKREQLPVFRAALVKMVCAPRARLLPSGPWPPYNFAVPRCSNWPAANARQLLAAVS